MVILFTELPVLAQEVDQISIAESTSTDFSLKLFNAVTQDSTDNVIISPFSAYLALSMVLNGAAGNTNSQMAKVLGITSDTAFNERNHSLLVELNRNDKVKLKIANAIFTDKSAPFKTSFIDNCKKIYDAKAECIDFRNTNTTLQSINAWCKAKTEDKIPILIDSIKPGEKMVILDAVYFKGEWASAFKEVETDDDKFITASGDIADVKMMHQRQKLFYFKGDTFKAVAISYAGNSQHMCIFLPNKKLNPAQFLAQFTEKNWQEWMNSFRITDVNLSLPKFSLCFSKDLSSGLNSIGITEAFDTSKADFSKLICFGYKASIDQVLQKIYLDLDEKGTEAAATAAAIAVQTAVSISPQPVEFRVDHPFVLALVDNDSKEILFLGSIVKP